MRPPVTDDPATTPKALLFCPDCGHRSHVDGDWRVTETPTGTEYACPDCGTIIQARPRLDARGRRAGTLPTAVVQPVATLLRALPFLRP